MAFRLKSSSVLLSNALWNIIGTLSNIIILFFLYPFLIGRLGDSNYGFFLFLSTVTGIAGVANLGLGEATLRYIAYYHGREDTRGENRVLSSSFWMNTVLGLVMTAGIILFSGGIINLVKDSQIDPVTGVTMLKISAVTFLIRFTGGLFFSVPQAYQKYHYSTLLTILEALLRVAGYVGSIVYGYGLTGLVMTELILAGYYFIASYAVMKMLNIRLTIFKVPSKAGLSELFGYGFYAFLGQLVGLLWQYTDRILLTVFLGTAALTYFVVPQQLITKVFTLVTAAGAVLFPRFSSMTDKEEIKKLFLVTTILFLYLTIVAFAPMTIVIREFISLWVSPEFASRSAVVASILAASYILRGGFIPYESLYRGLGKPKGIFVITLVSSIVIVATDAVLIPLIGLNGAGLAYVFSSLVGIGAFLYAWKKLLGQKDASVLVRFLVIPLFGSYALLCAVYFAGSRLFTGLNWFSFILYAAAVFLIFAGSLSLYLWRTREFPVIISTLQSKILSFRKDEKKDQEFYP
jgi:O-antigen/teichoic acid export membrane protein